MDNSAQKPQEPLVSKPEPSKPSSNKGVLKYLGVEVAFIAVIILVIVGFFLKPNINLSFPKKQKAPAQMNFSKPVNNTVSGRIQKAPVAPPEILTITIADNGITPAEAQATSKGTVLRFQNNGIVPAEIIFSNNLSPNLTIPSFASADTPSIVTTGEYTFTVKNSSSSGKIIFK